MDGIAVSNSLNDQSSNSANGGAAAARLTRQPTSSNHQPYQPSQPLRSPLNNMASYNNGGDVSHQQLTMPPVVAGIGAMAAPAVGQAQHRQTSSTLNTGPQPQHGHAVPNDQAKRRREAEVIEEEIQRADHDQGTKRRRKGEKAKLLAEYKAKGLTQKGRPRKQKVRKRKDLTPELKTLYEKMKETESKVAHSISARDEAERLVQEAQRKLQEASAMLVQTKQEEMQLEEEILQAELRLDNDFTRNYQRLIAYQQEHGKCTTVSASQHPELNRFVRRMRVIKNSYEAGRHYYRGLPIKYHIRALDRIGFIWNSYTDQWQTQFDKMIAYKEVHGHCCVPKAYEADPALGAWVHRQRYFYKLYHEGKPNQLTAERIELLNSVGFSWGGSSNTPIEETIVPVPTKPRNGYKAGAEEEWEQCFQLAHQFNQTFGHFRFASSDDPENRNNQLRDWASWQRKQYKLWKRGRPCYITDDQVRRLDEIGFDWRQAKVASASPPSKSVDFGGNPNGDTDHIVTMEEGQLTTTMNAGDI